MAKKNASMSNCPGCGKSQRSDNMKRHMLTCKKFKAREIAVTTPAAFKAALDTKDAQLAAAERRIAQLEAMSNTTNITVNATIHNYLTINVVPLLNPDGDFLSDETIPERSLVRERLKRKRAPEAVPTYLRLKHFNTGPEFGNIRISGAPKKLEVVQRGVDGTCAWVGAPKGTLRNLVSFAFEHLDEHYDAASIPDLEWQRWKDEEKLHGKGMCKQPAFQKTIDDVWSMVDRAHSHLPRETLQEGESKEGNGRALEEIVERPILPRPTQIQMNGDGGSIRSGKYIYYVKNEYVLEAEATRQLDLCGYVSDEVLRFGFLSFTFDESAWTWLLEAKSCREEAPFAKEQLNHSWRVLSEDKRNWIDAHPSVRARF